MAEQPENFWSWRHVELGPRQLPIEPRSTVFFALISEGESGRVSTVRGGPDGARDNEEE
jgi:hypothetical protein